MADYATRCGLYIISPQSVVPDQFATQLEQAFSGGAVDVFQLRLKDVTDSEIIDACRILIPICHNHGTQFILNDAVHLVNRVGADGAHIGVYDGTIEDARKELGKGKILGASCYGDLDRAIDAATNGADYVAFGAFYETQTKTPRARPTPDILKWWTDNSIIPWVAIGGIKHYNCAPLVQHGADLVAVVTAIWDDPGGAGEAVRKLNQAIDASALNLENQHIKK